MDKYLELFAELFAVNGSIDLPLDEIDDKRAVNRHTGGLESNIHNGTVVLAIGETTGTVVKEATTTAYDEFAFPLGTFHTYFAPFYLTDVWQPIHEITIETLRKTS